MLASAPRQRGIARTQEHEMIEIRTGETECATAAGQEDPRSAAKIVTAFIAARVPGRHEDTQVARGAIGGGAFNVI
jgi:hypothetical protein